MLHVTNGDSVVETLREAVGPADVLPWRDVLHDGPVPAVDPARLRQVRADHLAARGWGDAAEVERSMSARDLKLEEHVRDEYTLWFDADLYDQLQLAQVLDALAHMGADPDRITLVSTGEYSGIAHYGGLGELDVPRLEALAWDGLRLSGDALTLATRAWEAFTAPEPDGLSDIAGTRSPELRHLGEAFARLRAEYPSRIDGLSLTQRRILVAASEGAPTAAEVFQRVWDAEPRPFLGDTVCWTLIRELAGCPAPLLEIDEDAAPFPRRHVRLTADGREVLEGRQDQVRRNGVDRWVGGVHLAGHSVPWRYDERLETLLAGDA